MTSLQVAHLHFEGSREAAKKRVQKLKAARLIAERERAVTEKSVLFLLKKGIQTLAESGRLEMYPHMPLRSLERRADVGDSTVAHEIDVMDVKAAFHIALQKHPRFSVAEFITWPLLCQFEPNRPGSGSKTPLVKPDGFIRIHEKESEGLSERVFFLEVDRSTESQDKLVRRVADYSSHYTSGDFAVKCGGKRSDFKQFPFRLLIVLLNHERRNNTAKQLLDVRHLPNQVCLSTLDEIRNDALGNIKACFCLKKPSADGGARIVKCIKS